MIARATRMSRAKLIQLCGYGAEREHAALGGLEAVARSEQFCGGLVGLVHDTQRAARGFGERFHVIAQFVQIGRASCRERV